jgi:hypothetical protein
VSFLKYFEMACMVIPITSAMSFCFMWGWLCMTSRRIWNFVNSPLFCRRRVWFFLGKVIQPDLKFT